jgi:RNA polymerase sigma-54 factor
VAADGSVNLQSAPAPAPSEPKANGDDRTNGANGEDDSYGDSASDDYGSDWSLDDFARRPQGDDDERRRCSCAKPIPRCANT